MSRCDWRDCTATATHRVRGFLKLCPDHAADYWAKRRAAALRDRPIPINPRSAG